jgi:hypothetical protein
MRQVLVLVSFQATTHHVITHDVMWVMSPELDIDKFKFLQVRSLGLACQKSNKEYILK